MGLVLPAQAAGWRRRAVFWHVCGSPNCSPPISKGRIHADRKRRHVCATRGGTVPGKREEIFLVPSGGEPEAATPSGLDSLSPDWSVVSQFAVAALSECCKPLRIQERRSETAATEFKLRHYRLVCRRRPLVFQRTGARVKQTSQRGKWRHVPTRLENEAALCCFWGGNSTVFTGGTSATSSPRCALSAAGSESRRRPFPPSRRSGLLRWQRPSSGHRLRFLPIDVGHVLPKGERAPLTARAWSARLVHGPAKKPRTPKPGVRATRRRRKSNQRARP
jgi:hypothetical protein